MQKWIDASASESVAVVQQKNETSSAKNRSNGEDTSLTSLNWLPEFKIQSIDGKEDKVLSKSSASSVHSTDSCASSSGSWTQESEVEKDECFVPLSPIKRCRSQTIEFEKDPLRFEDNSSKPPFSYTTIIYLAIRSCNKDKVMLSDIYQWIKDHFKYYRIAESTWQNSVRHNLSLNQFFRKIPRGEGDPGKGSFWQINPDYEHLLKDDKELQRLVQQQNGVRTPAQRKRSKTRRKAHSYSESFSNARSKVTTDNGSMMLGTKKHCKSDNNQRLLSTSSPPMVGVDPCHLPGDLDWVSLLSSQKYGCTSCIEGQHYKPAFGSPVLMGTPTELDLVPSTSVSMLPITAQLPPNKIPDVPSQRSGILTSSLDEIITTQESPAPLLPPWAVESRPFSPTHFSIEHPWAESNRGPEAGIHKLNRHWSSPAGEVMWSNPQINRSNNNKLHLAQLI